MISIPIWVFITFIVLSVPTIFIIALLLFGILYDLITKILSKFDK